MFIWNIKNVTEFVLVKEGVKISNENKNKKTPDDLERIERGEIFMYNYRVIVKCLFNF